VSAATLSTLALAAPAHAADSPLRGVYRDLGGASALRVDAAGRIRSPFQLSVDGARVEVRFVTAAQPLPGGDFQYVATTTFPVAYTNGTTCRFPARLELDLLATGDAVDAHLSIPRSFDASCRYSRDSSVLDYAFERAQPPALAPEASFTDSTGGVWALAPGEGGYSDNRDRCSEIGASAGATLAVPSLDSLTAAYRDGLADPVRNPAFGAALRDVGTVWTRTPDADYPLYLRLFDASTGRSNGMALPDFDDFGQLCEWLP
jgi:hypothetical protein